MRTGTLSHRVTRPTDTAIPPGFHSLHPFLVYCKFFLHFFSTATRWAIADIVWDDDGPIPNAQGQSGNPPPGNYSQPSLTPNTGYGR
jgi:hypothetical protein